MTYNPDLDDRYGVRGEDTHGYVLFDYQENVFVRTMDKFVITLETRRQAEALAEVMNIEDAERKSDGQEE